MKTLHLLLLFIALAGGPWALATRAAGGKVPADPTRLVRDLGFDSVTFYVWVHHVILPRQQTDYNEVCAGNFKYWAQAGEQLDVPFFANVAKGWDPSPRCDQGDTLDDSGYPFNTTAH